MNISGAIPGNQGKADHVLGKHGSPCDTVVSKVAQTSETLNMIKSSTWLPGSCSLRKSTLEMECGLKKIPWKSLPTPCSARGGHTSPLHAQWRTGTGRPKLPGTLLDSDCFPFRAREAGKVISRRLHREDVSINVFGGRLPPLRTPGLPAAHHV